MFYTARNIVFIHLDLLVKTCPSTELILSLLSMAITIILLGLILYFTPYQKIRLFYFIFFSFFEFLSSKVIILYSFSVCQKYTYIFKLFCTLIIAMICLCSITQTFLDEKGYKGSQGAIVKIMGRGIFSYKIPLLVNCHVLGLDAVKVKF